MKLTLMQFVSLDGVSQGPGAADEDTSGDFKRGGWVVPYADEDFQAAVVAWGEDADGFLFGRRTYEAFAAYWPGVTNPDDPVASRLNGLPKYVASRTLEDPSWGPVQILAGDGVAEVAELKATGEGELQIHGSAELGGAAGGRPDRRAAPGDLPGPGRRRAAPLRDGRRRRPAPALGEDDAGRHRPACLRLNLSSFLGAVRAPGTKWG
jgi:dihydrofolate reductase